MLRTIDFTRPTDVVLDQGDFLWDIPSKSLQL
jgi:hypothetical protein